MIDFLKQLGIEYPVEQSSDGSQVIDLMSSEAFGKTYSILDKAAQDSNNDLEYLEDSSSLSLINANLQYQYNNTLCSLVGDFEHDIYKIVIKDI